MNTSKNKHQKPDTIKPNNATVETSEFDVVIVGAGVAGAVVADALSQEGIEVCLLEAGPDIRDRNLYVSRFLSGKVTGNAWPYHYHDKAPSPPIGNPNRYYENTGPVEFISTYERRVGGTTWHWLGNCPRFVPEDFKLQSTFGLAVDWPIDYQTLEPWYQKAEEALGVSANAKLGTNPYRSTPYPNKGFPLGSVDMFVQEGATKAGLTYNGKPIQVVDIPQARNSKQCMGSSSCIPICPMGAKYEAIQHVSKAQKQGVELRSESVVKHLLTNKTGKVEVIEYLDWSGELHKVRAQYFILAANAIESAKVLLMSANNQCHHGLANRSLQVGRNLMDHPSQLGFALAPKAIYPYRGPLQLGCMTHLREGKTRSERSASLLLIQNNGWSWAKNEPQTTYEQLIDQGFIGEELQQHLEQHMNRQLMLVGMLEQLPNEINRISLSSQKDALGLPHPKINYRIEDYVKAGAKQASQQMETLFKATNCGSVEFSTTQYGAGHILGTTRMGSDPNTSVVDEYGVTHDHPNLYIVGASVFPTAGTANPTLTLVALALRSADHLANRLRPKVESYIA